MNDQALEKVKQFYNKRNRLPNYKEMRKLFNNPPCTAVAYSIYKWKSNGLIEDEGNRYRPTSKFFGLPLLGNIKAGYPTEEDGYMQRMLLQDYLIENPQNSYLLQIETGDMQEAGIQAGDVVIIDKSKEARVGDIVATRFGNEWVLSTHADDSHSSSRIRNHRDRFSVSMKRSQQDSGVIVSVIRKFN